MGHSIATEKHAYLHLLSLLSELCSVVVIGDTKIGNRTPLPRPLILANCVSLDRHTSRFLTRLKFPFSSLSDGSSSPIPDPSGLASGPELFFSRSAS